MALAAAAAELHPDGGLPGVRHAAQAAHGLHRCAAGGLEAQAGSGEGRASPPLQRAHARVHARARAQARGGRRPGERGGERGGGGGARCRGVVV
eukprot:1184554-Prorocentrum_minimum.AAC.3